MLVALAVGVAIVVAFVVMAVLAILHWVIPVIVAVVVVVGGGYLWFKVRNLERKAEKYEAEHRNRR